jgi:hypothetical protein
MTGGRRRTSRYSQSRRRTKALPNGVLMRVLLSTIGSRGDVQPLVARVGRCEMD